MKPGSSTRSVERALEALADAESVEQEWAEFLILLDRSAALRHAVNSIVGGLGLDLATAAIPTRQGLMIRAVAGNRTELLRNLQVPTGLGIHGKSLEIGAVHWVEDYSTAPTITHEYDDIAAAEGIGRMVAVPVIHDGRVVALLTGAARTNGPVDGRLVEGMEGIGHRAGIALAVADRVRLSNEIAAQEERRHLALQLHDTVGALLFTIGARLRELGDALHDDPLLGAQAAVLERQAAEATAALRESIQALSVPPTETLLPVALRADCRAFSERTGIPANLVALTEIPPLDAARVRALSGATREALLNVEKHAAAQSVVVSVSESARRVVVAVTDDGIGLNDPLEAKGSPGLGLEAHRERLGHLGGDLSLSTNDEGGTTIRAWVPI